MGVIVSKPNASTPRRVALDRGRSLNGRRSLPTTVLLDMLVASAAARSLAFNGRCRFVFLLVDFPSESSAESDDDSADEDDDDEDDDDDDNELFGDIDFGQVAADEAALFNDDDM